jgi:hypothetical protein
MSSAYRQGSSDYISEKLGNMGLVLGLQSFMPSKFKQQVSERIYSFYSIEIQASS